VVTPAASSRLRHPDALMLSTLPADTAVHIGVIRAVLEVVSTHRIQCRLQRSCPVLVGFGESQTWLDVRPKSPIAILNGLPA
jgi:hypothetical protein